MKTITIFCTILVACCAMWIARASAQSSLEQLEKELAAPSDRADRALPSGYLGLIADNPPDGLRGVQVISVKKAGPAEIAGIQPGDRIVAIDRQIIASLDEMSAVLEKHAPGDPAVFEISRGGRPLTVEVTLAVRPAVALPAPARDVATSGRPILGVNATTVTDEARTRYGLVVRSEALISTLRPESPAERAGLQVGNVIVAIDGRRIDSPADLVAQLSASRPGEEIEVSYYDGDRFLKRTARLGASGEPIASPTRVAKPELSPPASDDSALRRIEGLIDRLTPRKPAAVVEAKDADVTSEVETLRKQIELLNTQLEQLQRRVRELEDRDAK